VIAETTTTVRDALRTCRLPVLLVGLGTMPCTAQAAGEGIPEQVTALKLVVNVANSGYRHMN
jgi:hypothetical protein